MYGQRGNPQHILWASAFRQKFAEAMGTTKLSIHLKDREEEESKSVSSKHPPTTSYHHTLIRANDSKTSRDKMKTKKNECMSANLYSRNLLLHLSALVGFFKGLHIGEGKPISSLCNLCLD